MEETINHEKEGNAYLYTKNIEKRNNKRTLNIILVLFLAGRWRASFRYQQDEVQSGPGGDSWPVFC